METNTENLTDSNNENKTENRLPVIDDACKACKNFSKRKRRLSTIEPARILCNFNCGTYVWEIHYGCLDCAIKLNSCPWCGASPYIK